MKPKVEEVIKRIERFLMFRPRTEKEVRFKLKGLKFSPAIIDETLNFLISDGYINDTAFGYDWAESRIRSRKIGKNKLKNELKAEMVVISNDQRALDLAEVALPLPADLPEWLSPIPAIVVGQLFAYHLTVVKGYNPEQPRIIHKVTETE